jgi:hypothetical protein
MQAREGKGAQVTKDMPVGWAGTGALYLFE